MKSWIKLYTEILNDPKMGRLTDRQYRTCINLFLDADGELIATVYGAEVAAVVAAALEATAPRSAEPGEKRHE